VFSSGKAGIKCRTRELREVGCEHLKSIDCLRSPNGGLLEDGNGNLDSIKGR
jgi:hypothetical protein